MSQQTVNNLQKLQTNKTTWPHNMFLQPLLQKLPWPKRRKDSLHPVTSDLVTPPYITTSSGPPNATNPPVPISCQPSNITPAPIRPPTPSRDPTPIRPPTPSRNPTAISPQPQSGIQSQAGTQPQGVPQPQTGPQEPTILQDTTHTIYLTTPHMKDKNTLGPVDAVKKSLYQEEDRSNPKEGSNPKGDLNLKQVPKPKEGPNLKEATNPNKAPTSSTCPTPMRTSTLRRYPIPRSTPTLILEKDNWHCLMVTNLIKFKKYKELHTFLIWFGPLQK